ncbi:MAG TPA: ATP-binding cassette domain-containing protein [Caulobacteraceae bacterium]|nr:ATP-binding cassette domain-containing protein [Caulobacteraceae bacterium]
MAAPILALKDVRLADAGSSLFEGVDIAIEPRVRATLVGRNGAGKSTLLRILAGSVEVDGGERAIRPGTRIAFVPQEPQVTGATLADYAASGDAPRHQAEAALETLGLDPAKPTTGLSGGEIRRAALAKAFAEEPDVLLLDEPTNHLDIFAIQTLEAELAASRAAALIVSHDRAFLTRVTQRCYWLYARRLKMLDKGFAAFDEWSRKLMADEEETLRRLNKAIERETYWFYRSITAQRTRNEGRARELQKMRAERAERMREQQRPMELAIDAGGQAGKLVAELKGVAKGFGERVILKPFSSRILRGDRVAIVGPNGAGKTTLVKIMLGEMAPDEGTVKLGTGLQVTYLDQARDDLKASMTLWDALTPGGGDSVLVRGQSRHVAAYARDFLFHERQLRQPVSTLSGGERNRLLLARALAKPANMLVLDEPTNDLDMDTLDLLEDLLADYEGTLLLVSHDRDFIDRLATSTIALNGRGDAVETPGGWADFTSQNPGFFDPPSAAPTRAAAPTRRPDEPKKPAKLSYKDARRLEELNRLLAETPATIAALEKELEDPQLYARNPARFDAVMKSLARLRTAMAAAEDEWLALEEKKEALS